MRINLATFYFRTVIRKKRSHRMHAFRIFENYVRAERQKIRNSRVSYDGVKLRKQRGDALPKLRRYRRIVVRAADAPLKHIRDVQANLIHHESI